MLPGQDQRDWDFAKKYDDRNCEDCSATKSLLTAEAYTGDGPAINSGFLDGFSNSPRPRCRFGNG